MVVIAEGVETFEEIAYLQSATSIKYAQGYYFYKPITLGEEDRENVAHFVTRKASRPREISWSRAAFPL